MNLLKRLDAEIFNIARGFSKVYTQSGDYSTWIHSEEMALTGEGIDPISMVGSLYAIQARERQLARAESEIK